MRILQLCKKFPYPLKDGESIAVTALSRSLHKLGCKVSLLAMNTHKHYFPLEKLPDDFNHYEEIFTAQVDNRLKPGKALLDLWRNRSYHISRFISEAYERELRQLLKRKTFDVIQLETPYLAPYIPCIRRHSNAAISMRAHNVEYEIWERITANTSFGLKRWYLRHLTERLRQYETEQLKSYDLLAAITERDLNHFREIGYCGPATVTPIGVESGRYSPDYSSYQRPTSLSFIGSLDWMPNLEGLDWFLEHVWGPLKARHPELELHIAGRNTPPRLKRLQLPGLVVHGEVPNATDFINQHSLMVVPLLSGSGMRAKILEGMALGKVVITTRIGLEGIAAEAGKQVLVADTPEEMIATLSRALKEEAVLQQMGERARKLVLQRYDSLAVARRLMDAYSELTVEVL